MKKIGMLKAMKFCARYAKLGEDERSYVRERQLRELVLHARESSPYYRELYEGVTEDFRLADLPPVGKSELMAHFDDWITDRSVTLADLEAFMQDLHNIGRRFRNQYYVFTTSGSTGIPLVALYTSAGYNIMGAINAVRAFARKEDMAAFIKRGGKSIGVFATGGFYLGNSSIRARLLAMPWKKRQMAVTSALLPIGQIVRELNSFGPAMLGGYPTVLELLIDEQKSGNLRINPVLIMTGGEYLSDALRGQLSQAFGCYVQTSYSCTEGGTIACECVERHFHINDDWIIVEPVDQDNRPVPDGVQSDKILLTNLYNYAQPFIRYEVTDRVVMHHERCACGNPSPWLTLEGRTDDVLRLTQDGRDVKIAPLAVYAILKEVHALKRFQLISHGGNRLELRLIPVDGVEKQQAFERACTALKQFLATHGVTDIDVSMNAENPMQHPVSGKFKHIVNAEPQR